MSINITACAHAVNEATNNYKEALKAHMRLQKEYNVPHETVEQAERIRASHGVVQRALHAYTVAVRVLAQEEMG